ncbi:MAG: hemolysin III family protein [Firmicutes bacterium]|nr:hemolysin III family protein [Bacillota bacterium]
MRRVSCPHGKKSPRSGGTRLSKTLRLREPVSGLTHLAGAVLSALGLVALLAVSHGQTLLRVGSLAVFGASLILLFAASAAYHLLPLSPSGTRALRRVDHIMIYILIAGTYTPLCLIPLRGPWGWSLFCAIWTLALAGIAMAIWWLHAPRWLSTTIYVIMGWLVVIAVVPLLHTVPPGGLVWLLIGGLFYTSGAVIYAIRRPNLVPGVFGFHEIWHLFVLAGALSHFWAVFRYLAMMP